MKSLNKAMKAALVRGLRVQLMPEKGGGESFDVDTMQRSTQTEFKTRVASDFEGDGCYP